MTTYDHIYILKDKDTGKILFTYTASSQRHKAVFSSRSKAEDALFWLKDEGNFEIVEI